MSQPASSARALFWMAILLSTLGTCGVGNGVGGLQASGPPAMSDLSAGGVTETAAETAQLVARTLFHAPLRRPLAAANVVVSCMLLVGGFLLALRRKIAVWWIGQAAIANAFWVVADTVSQAMALRASWTDLSAAFEREIRARLADTQLAEVDLRASGGGQVFWAYVGFFGFSALVRIGLYAWIRARVRRPDLQRELSR